MRKTFINTLVDIARTNPNVWLLTPDIGYSVLESFKDEFPSRFLNTGITEQATMSIAAGLALRGKIPFVYTIIPFLTMRCYEQIRVGPAYHNLPVKLIGVGAGYSYGAAGATHHAIEDISLMRSLPNMKVICPGDPWETESLLREAVKDPGPFYFRLGKNGEEVLHKNKASIELGKAATLSEGKDGALIATSNMLEQALEWKKLSLERGINLAVYSMHTIKPLDSVLIHELIDRKIPIASLEEHSEVGGLASSIADIIATSDKRVRFKKIAIRDQFCHIVGSHSFLRNEMGLSNFEEFFHFFSGCYV